MYDQLPLDFRKRVIEDLGSDGNLLLEAIVSTPPPTAIRYNKLKVSNHLTSASGVPWCELGHYLDERPSFTLDPLFHAGTYYVQEASSMVLSHVVKSIINADKPLLVLDLCAAPGGKTTLLRDELSVDSTIVANEIINHRAQILKENLIKWGSTNVMATNDDPVNFASSGLLFDLILVDAPCSGEGMFRKDPASMSEWSMESVMHCSARQSRILADIWTCLKPGGHIIYSTCTYNDSENIDQITAAVNSLEAKSIPIEIPNRWCFTPIRRENAFGYQAYINKVKGEGFFFSVLQKSEAAFKLSSSNRRTHKLEPLTKTQKELVVPFVNGDIVNSCYIHTTNGDVYYYPETSKDHFLQALSTLTVIYSGVKLGNITKNLFLPDHALALTSLVNQNIFRTNLSLVQAQDFLRRNLNQIDGLGKGWQLACYQNRTLGWYKQLGNRINNYYPVHSRIKNL